MNQHERDHRPLMTPATLEATVAALIERVNSGLTGIHDRLDSMRIDQSEHRAAAQGEAARLESITEGLLAREKERNGHIAELMLAKSENERRWESHREWSDERAQELKDLRQAHRDAELIAGAKKRLLSAQARWFLAGAGVAGSAATAIVALTDRM